MSRARGVCSTAPPLTVGDIIGAGIDAPPLVWLDGVDAELERQA